MIHPLKSRFAKTLSNLSTVFHGTAPADETGESEKKSKFLILVAAVLRADGSLCEEEVVEVRNFLLKNYSPSETDLFLKTLRDPASLQPYQQAAAWFADRPESEREKLLTVLFDIAHADRKLVKSEEHLLEKITAAMGIPEERGRELQKVAADRQARRESMFVSGTGVFAAITVLAIFILTATFLKSVFFGLVLATFFLPLEKWLESLLLKNPTVSGLLDRIGRFFAPAGKLTKIAAGKLKIGSQQSEQGLSPQEILEKEETAKREQRVNLACHLTLVSVILLFLAFTGGFAYMSTRYMQSGIQSFWTWANEKRTEAINDREKAKSGTADSERTATGPDVPGKTGKPSPSTSYHPTSLEKPAAGPGLFTGYMKKITNNIEGWRPLLEKIPFFPLLRQTVSSVLQDENTRKELVSILLNRSGGLISFTTGLLGALADLIFNLVLTLFFFSFFLQKLAMFQSRGKESGTQERSWDYFVDSIFNSSWLPKLSSETREETREIIDTVLDRLKTWVRSYISIIIIETILYSLAFIILGLPYPLLIGMVAGCTILLPFLGPIASCILTLAVTLAAAPTTSMVTLVLILVVYLLINGIFEQLFLFPRLAGESLGLNTLETITVVILGGMFAGIGGMIFAVPAASILKYLVPKIYACWRPRKET